MAHNDRRDRARSDLVPFSELLLRHRLRSGLSQTDLAQKAGLQRSCLEMLENGERLEPQRWTLAALADALGVSPAAFFEKKSKKSH